MVGGSLLLLGVGSAQALRAPTDTGFVQGRVYAGDVGDESSPLEGVTVSVYGADGPYPDLGTFIRSTTTDDTGLYGLPIDNGDGPYGFYHVVETNPAGYVSVGATTVSGTVRTASWIEFAGPLNGQTFTGNKFKSRARCSGILCTIR